MSLNSPLTMEQTENQNTTNDKIYSVNGIKFKVSNKIPEVYKKCNEVFKVEWNEGIVITYGDTVYSKHDLSQDLLVHESVHVKQQMGMGVKKWWGRYFEDKEFRLSQEVEAYRAQIRFIKQEIKDRNACFRICRKIWLDMEKLYGGMCDYKQARELTNN